MSEDKGTKNKLFKGLTEYDILVWEEEKMRHQRKAGRKITDVEFLRYLLMAASRPVISAKDGVAGGFLTGQGPVYKKADTLTERYRTNAQSRDGGSDHAIDAPRMGVDREMCPAGNESMSRAPESTPAAVPGIYLHRAEDNTMWFAPPTVRSQGLTRD